MTARPNDLDKDMNRDPITGAPGAHPAGTAAGAAAGGLAGAAVGTMVAGPVGTVVGAAIGAISGGLAGKGIAEEVNPTGASTVVRDGMVRDGMVRDGMVRDGVLDHTIVGTAGTHPVGTVAGAGAGAAAGAAMGSLAGPIGVAAGATIGAIAGGLAGKGVAGVVNPAAEDAYWNGSYSTTPYYVAGRTSDDYAPAYRLGYTSRGRYPSYEAAERELSNDWARVKGQSRLSWEEAKHATRDAWHRVEGAMPGAVHGDGR